MRFKRSPILLLVFLFGFILFIGVLMRYKKEVEIRSITKAGYSLLEVKLLRRVENNYGQEIEEYTLGKNIPASYFKALAALECGGHFPSGTRYEKHVFQQLRMVRNKQKKSYGTITVKEIGDAKDDALKNLSTSWGPFQLMGYQCVALKTQVRDIRGKDAVKWGIHWVEKAYGNYLRKGEFKNAFHIHNTGKPYPKYGKPLTTNPDYVENGLRYMKYFEER